MKEDIFVRCPVKLFNLFGRMKKTLVLVLFLLSGAVGYAQNYKLHSLFIFSFTRYVQWPDAYNEGDFEIVVLGDTPLLDELKTMAQTKKVGDRTIRITKVNSIGELKKCHILFVPSSRTAQFGEVLSRVSNQPVLIVTEESGLGAKGSIINFIIRDGKLAFELNQNAVARQNLRVSNELSRLAILI
jgi:hypothetical protein